MRGLLYDGLKDVWQQRVGVPEIGTCLVGSCRLALCVVRLGCQDGGILLKAEIVGNAVLGVDVVGVVGGIDQRSALESHLMGVLLVGGTDDGRVEGIFHHVAVLPLAADDVIAVHHLRLGRFAVDIDCHPGAVLRSVVGSGEAGCLHPSGQAQMQRELLFTVHRQAEQALGVPRYACGGEDLEIKVVGHDVGIVSDQQVNIDILAVDGVNHLRNGGEYLCDILPVGLSQYRTSQSG